MSTLTAMLSVRTGDSREQTESFLREFFGLITGGLEAGDSIKIPDVGIFKTINVEARKSVNVNTGEETMIPEHRKVVFLPGKELAATVNAPFEMFQTIALTDELAAVFEEPQPAVDPAVDQEAAPEPTVEQETSTEPTMEQEEAPEPTVGQDMSPEPTVEQEAEPEHIVAPESESESGESDDSDQSDPSALQADGFEKPDYREYSEPESTVIVKRRFWPGFFIGFGAACLCMLIAMGIDAYVTLTEPADDNMTVTAVTPSPVTTQTAPNDSVVSAVQAESGSVESQTVQTETLSVPTQPSDKPVYDTISRTRYLTTMAKDHYGNFHLWPYIYMENEKILGHPDRIKPGTQVVVPDLTKYGVDPNKPADIEKAKELGLDIYARYNK